MNLNDKQKELESNKEEHIVNNPKPAEKIITEVKSLKNGKSAEADLISNEMIESGLQILLIPLSYLIIYFILVPSLKYGMKVIFH